VACPEQNNEYNKFRLQSLFMIYDVNLSTRTFIGVRDKMLHQASAFSRVFSTVKLICLDLSTLVCMTFRNGLLVDTENLMSDVKVGRFYLSVELILERFLSSNPVFYIRFSPMVNMGLPLCINRISKTESKLFLEVPTFPYDQELNDEERDLDSKYRDMIHSKADIIFSPSVPKGGDKIFGSRLIKILNGVDSRIFKTALPVFNAATFGIIAIGWLSPWHGFDRIISGLRDFKKSIKNVDIHLHVVGDGPYASTLKDYVQKEDSQSLVTLWGVLQGKQLDELFSQCQLGVDSLAWHRVNVYEAETLKGREYIARGLPLIQGYKNSSVQLESPGLIQVPADDSPIDLVTVYQQVKKYFSHGGPSIHREFAEKNYNWENIAKQQFYQAFVHLSA